LNYISTGVSGEYTISFWLNLLTFNDLTNGEQAILFGDELSQNNGVMFQMHKDYGFGAYTAGAGTGVGYTNQIPNLNTWKNYTVTQKSDGIHLYIDGVYWGRLTTQKNTETTTDTRIGLFYQVSGAAQRPLHGIVDELKIYNRALTQGEIAYLVTH
jgi:hypothetical protein